MPRPKKATKAEPAKANPFVDAINFVGMIAKDVGAPFETHIVLANNAAVMFNGTLSCGQRITDDLFACPNAKLLMEGLSKCKDDLTITQLDQGRLTLKSNKFKATVPCIDPMSIQTTFPDQMVAPIDDRFKKALEVVGVLASENAQNVIQASILMNGQSLVSTDRAIIFEYWHGINLPVGISLPKSLVAPLTKCKKPLKGFGCSNSSVTFWFEDDSWLKSQLYADEWPLDSITRILNVEFKPHDIPAGLWDGLAAVEKFSEDGGVYFDNGAIRSHKSEVLGASYEVPSLRGQAAFTARYMNLIKPHATSINFYVPGPHDGTMMLYFYGDQMRGALMARGS